MTIANYQLTTSERDQIYCLLIHNYVSKIGDLLFCEQWWNLILSHDKENIIIGSDILPCYLPLMTTPNKILLSSCFKVVFNVQEAWHSLDTGNSFAPP